MGIFKYLVTKTLLLYLFIFLLLVILQGGMEVICFYLLYTLTNLVQQNNFQVHDIINYFLLWLPYNQLINLIIFTSILFFMKSVIQYITCVATYALSLGFRKKIQMFLMEKMLDSAICS